MKMLNSKYLSAIAALIFALGISPLQAAPYFAGGGNAGAGADKEEESDAKVSFGGEIELEYSFAQEEEVDGTKHNSSRLIVETVELEAEIEVNENVSANLLFLIEEGETEPVDLDEATITIRNLARTGLSLTGGRLYIPFGSFESNMASDPLTLELAEMRESAIMLGLEKGGFSASVYTFNGDTTTDPENDEVNHWGFSLALSKKRFKLGVDYISNLGDTDLVSQALEANTNYLMYEQVPALAAHAGFRAGPTSLYLEMVQAQDSFLPAELAYDGEGAEPGATHVEAAFRFEMGGEPATLAISSQTTTQAEALGLPETFTGVTFSRELPEGAEFAVEYHNIESYEGEKESELMFVLGVEF